MASMNEKRSRGMKKSRGRRLFDSTPLAELGLSQAAHCHLLLMLHRDRERRGQRKRDAACVGERECVYVYLCSARV
jgi:hypothetical protein